MIGLSVMLYARGVLATVMRLQSISEKSLGHVLGATVHQDGLEVSRLELCCSVFDLMTNVFQAL